MFAEPHDAGLSGADVQVEQASRSLYQRQRRMLIVTSVPSTLTAFLLPFALHFRSRGWRVEAVANGADQCSACREAFDAVHTISWTRRPSDPVNVFRAPGEIRAIVRRHGFDVVHVHDPIAAFVTRFALRHLRRSIGLRVVYTAHGFHFYRGGSVAQNIVFRAAEELAAGWTDALVVINREDLEAALRFRRLDPSAVTYSPGIGVDLARYDPSAVSTSAVDSVRSELGLSPSTQLLLMVAELNPGKRHADAIRALQRSGRSDVVLAFAGVGPLRPELEELAASLGLGSRVRFLGFRSDIDVLLAASFALILPSEREGLPRCVMEALCLERPVIATRIRGVSELVSAETGVLVDVGDVDGLANAIERLASSPVLATAMGRRGRASMAPFDLGNVIQIHESLYERLLDR